MNLRKKWLNKLSIKGVLLTLTVTIPPLISTTVFTTMLQTNYQNYWLFDNKTFTSLSELYDYINKNTDVSSFQANARNYVLNDQVFNTKLELNNYLNTNFPIRDDVYTFHNPENYVINSAGELSKQVLWNEDSKVTTVYKGHDGVGYKTRKQALDTFKTYDKVYQLDDGMEFANFYDAYQYLMEVKLKELENDPKQLLYQNGGLYQSKEAVKSWLRKNIKRGFEYKGREFILRNQLVNKLKKALAKFAKAFLISNKFIKGFVFH